MNHSDADDASAAKTGDGCICRLRCTRTSWPDAGLFWEQLADRGKELKALNTPKLGDSLLKPDGTPWMAGLAHEAPKINWDDLTQIPALPLGSWLKTDPWDDRVHMLNAKQYAPMNARDKMPLEVTPVYFKLQRYEDANCESAGFSGPHQHSLLLPLQQHSRQPIHRRHNSSRQPRPHRASSNRRLKVQSAARNRSRRGSSLLHREIRIEARKHLSFTRNG